jgi:hypothetical protein
MKEEQGLIEREIDCILFTNEYITTLKNIGFSREFRLTEQIRKQRECIEFLAVQIDKLKAEILKEKNKDDTLQKIIF